MFEKFVLAVLTSALLASTASASLRGVRCDVDQTQTTVSVSVLSGDEVGVVISNVDQSSGYDITSAEGLEGKFWKSTSAIEPSSKGKMTFRIKSDDQNQTTSTYTFQYKLKSGDGSVLSTCLVTVEKK